MRATNGWILAGALVAGLAGPATAQTVSERLGVCTACHGASGTSATEGVPSLGAQMPDYAVAQLYVFREKLRVAPPMNDMAAGLSDDDLQALSAAIAKFPPPKSAAATLSAAEVAQGAELIGHYRCNSCHGATLAGAGQIPRLAGQREDYLLKSLVGYKSNTRVGYNPAMNEVSQEVKSEDIPLLAKFISQYR